MRFIIKKFDVGIISKFNHNLIQYDFILSTDLPLKRSIFCLLNLVVKRIAVMILRSDLLGFVLRGWDTQQFWQKWTVRSFSVIPFSGLDFHFWPHSDRPFLF